MMPGSLRPGPLDHALSIFRGLSSFVIRRSNGGRFPGGAAPADVRKINPLPHSQGEPALQAHDVLRDLDKLASAR
jgi:hypothetical protein